MLVVPAGSRPAALRTTSSVVSERSLAVTAASVAVPRATSPAPSKITLRDAAARLLPWPPSAAETE